MRPLSELMGRSLEWRRERLLSPSYDLVMDDEIVANVQSHGFTRRSSTLRVAEGVWFTRYAHLFSRRIHVTDRDGNGVGEYSGWLRRGELRLDSGERYAITMGLFPASVRVTSQAGSLLVTQHWSWPAFRRLARVTVEPAGTAEPRLGLVAAFAFAVLLERRRAAARSG